MVEDYLEGTIDHLSISPIISSFTVVRREVGDEEGYILTQPPLPSSHKMKMAKAEYQGQFFILNFGILHKS